MNIRTRKLIGTVALLLLVSVWGLLAMALAQSVLTDINGFCRRVLLCGGRARLGAAGHAVGQVDGAAGRAHDRRKERVENRVG